MDCEELFQHNIKENMEHQIKSINLDELSNEELLALKGWLELQKEKVDTLILEDEVVGYAYCNFGLLIPKINVVEQKRKLFK